MPEVCIDVCLSLRQLIRFLVPILCWTILLVANTYDETIGYQYSWSPIHMKRDHNLALGSCRFTNACMTGCCFQGRSCNSSLEPG